MICRKTHNRKKAALLLVLLFTVKGFCFTCNTMMECFSKDEYGIGILISKPLKEDLIPIANKFWYS